MNKVWIGSPNYTQGRGGQSVQGVILHWMVGSLASADATFQNRSRNTSAHYGVEDDNAHQYVKEEDTAYQAGNWGVNQQTIGIEHSAQPGRAPSDASYETSAQLIADAHREYGFPIDSAHIRHHYEIVATQCSGDVADGGVDEDRILRRANELAAGLPVNNAPVPTPAPVPAAATIAGLATVTVMDGVYVRTAPNRTAPLGGSQYLNHGQSFNFVEAVQGESVNGISTWLKSTRGNYVWAGALDYPTTPTIASAPPQSGTANVIRTANVRTAPNTSAPLGGSRQLQAGQSFSYSALVHGQMISQNGTTTDLWYHSLMGNYVWAGNCN